MQAMLRYYITDRTQFGGNEEARTRALLDAVGRACAGAVDFICLREKDLTPKALELLARKLREVITTETRFIVHSRPDVAIAVRADGVHLSSSPGELNASELRSLWHSRRSKAPVIVSSCHTRDDVLRAVSYGSDFAVFGPIFEKAGEPVANGLDRLAEVARLMPVLALGGVNEHNTERCVAAGAVGYAAIRHFQQ